MYEALVYCSNCGLLVGQCLHRRIQSYVKSLGTKARETLAQERGQKALEKRVAGLTSLLVASTLLNIAMPMVVGPLRKLTFVAAAFFGTKALPALL